MEADQTVTQSVKQLPAQSADVPSLNRHAVPTESTEVERVTAPSPTSRTKDPKKQAAGRASAAVRKAKQERLLEELRAAKEAIAPAATPVADGAPKEQPVTGTARSASRVKQQPLPAPADPGDPVAEAAADWTPWILVGAGLAALCVWHYVPMSRSLTPLGASQPDCTSTTPRCAQHLKVPDPFHME